MMRDPYKILGLAHSSTQDEIKQSYRKLARQYHPDRVSNPEDKENATASFAEIATAYALLTDERRKSQYDHIYKYGGFDDEDENEKAKENISNLSPPRNGCRSNDASKQHPGFYDNHNHASRKRKSSTGIGYVCTDPLAFLWTQGKVQIRQTVAGIQVPSRLQPGNDGLRFAFSAGFVSRSPSGIRQHSCSTTHFCQGKKFTRSSTTTFYPDGTKEVVIEGNDCAEQRYYSTYPDPNSTKVAGNTRNNEGVTQHDENSPWYVSAWSEIKDKLSMCYNPCIATGDRQ
jgi:curved DNA-binding protein CbpA